MPSAHIDTHTQATWKPICFLALFPPSLFLFFLSPALSAPQCFIQGLSIPLWINRDTLSACRRAVINVFPLFPARVKRQAFHTSSSQMLFSGQANRRHFLFRSSEGELGKTIPKKAKFKLIPYNTKEHGNITNKVDISTIPLFFLLFLVMGNCICKWNFVVRVFLEPVKQLWPTEKRR